MRRVVVVGNSGSGKSTVGRAVAERIGAAYVEVDSVYHQANWQPLPFDEFRQRLDVLTADGSWVIDGNYRAIREVVWSRADTVVWLDLPRTTVTRQIVGRTLGRVARRKELWNGNRERWRNFFSLNPEESVIVWSLTKHGHYRRMYGDAMADPAYGHLTFVRLRSRAEIEKFLASA